MKQTFKNRTAQKRSSELKDAGKPMKSSRVEIGTSGFSYKHWKKVFYPEDLPEDKWFDFYASRFSTLEVNVSFYHLPSKKTFSDWRRKSPPDFSFFVKGSRFITHIKRLKDCRAPLERFFDAALALKNKLAGVLWQLSPRTAKDASRLAVFLSELKRFPVTRHVFEFRHESWFDEDIESLLKEAGYVYCRADKPPFYRSLAIPNTGDFIYARRHGPLHFSSSYTIRELASDAEAIRSWRHKKIFVYFNNDGGGAAVNNAETLKELLDIQDH